MKIEFTDQKKLAGIERNGKNRAERPLDAGNVRKQDFHKKMESTETSGVKSIFTDSIVRLDAEYMNKPLKASDVLTSGEIEMLQKLFSTLRANRGANEYK